MTRGFLCAKVAKYLDRVYSPARVLYPLRRKKDVPKGGGTRNVGDFERITWDEALAEITNRFRQITTEFGSEAILPYSYGGTLGALNHGAMDRRFFHRLGASQLERNICSAAGEFGIKSVYGIKMGTEPEQFRHSKLIIAWGANIHGNNVHLWPFIEEARRAGRQTGCDRSVSHAYGASARDWHIPINPGTDVALALGMMHVIINENLYDHDYVARHTVGFDHLRDRVYEYPPELVARLTGISAQDIVRLAQEYAMTHPAAIRMNYGVQRSENGGSAARAICMLPCLTGSWKEVGGGLQLSLSGSFPLNKRDLERTDLMQKVLGRTARVVNMVELGKALATLSDPPIKALFVYGSNPAAVAPNHNLVVQQLRRDDLFTVVHEQFLTDTTDYADIVLPATTFFEHKDLQPSYGHYYLQVSHQAIAPVGESRSNVEMFRALAERIGFDDECFRESVDEMIDAALDTDHEFLAGITREGLERESHIRLNVASDNQPFLPFANGNFKTPSGKAELYSESLAAQGFDPIARFVPPTESRHANSNGHARYPLELLARKADNFLNSSFCNQPVVREMECPGLLEIHPDDARERGILEGQTVRVYNDRGAIPLVAHLTDAIQPKVVAARLDWAKLSEQGVNVNVLTSDRLTDMGESATFYSALVEVEAG